MRKLLVFVLEVLIVCVPVVAGAQITSASNGDWTNGATWVGGVVPTSTDDVVINAGDTVTVSDYNAVCNSVSFTGVEAQIKMAPNSLLTVYGNFTLAADTHCVFDEQWSATDAKIKFAGSAIQTLSGWSTSGGSTSFRDVIIDKTGGYVTTGGNNMRLGIQNSLEIINGEFRMAAQDDIEGRWATSGNYTYQNKPDVLIQANGFFETIDGTGAHHIRSGYDSGTGFNTPIGTWTVYGLARFRDGSTTKYNFLAMDVENGGKVITSTGNAGGQLEFGPIHVKSGGEVENYTTSDIYGASVVFTLDDGGLFDTKSTSTIFPAAFINNGTVRYSRDVTTTAQVVTDMDYVHLEISLDNGFSKTWNMTGDRTITGNLTVEYGTSLDITAAAPQSLTVNGQLDLDEGNIDTSVPNVAIVLGPSATIVESDTTGALGTVKTTRTVAQAVNETFGGIGLELNAAGSAPGVTEVTRVTGVALTIGGNSSIERYFDIAPTNNSGLDATVVFHYNESELNAIPEGSLKTYLTDAGRTQWQSWGSTIDEVANTLTSAGYLALYETISAGSAVASVVGDDSPPRISFLSQNHPNPFSSATDIAFGVDASGNVRIQIYDVKGRLVRDLANARFRADRHVVTWDGRDNHGRSVAGGVYFYRLVSESLVQTRKMVLIR
jgi:hypothetical protein